MKAKAYWSKVSPVALLTIVVAVAVSILTAVDANTRDQIIAQEQQKIDRLIGEMFPEMTRSEVDGDLYAVYAGDDRIGYAFKAVGNGYGGDINILVGLEDEETIKGITIISHTETPGLGTRIAESPFIDQFAGISISDVTLTDDGGQVDAITGSTISSEAVVDAVSATAMEMVRQLQGSE